MPTSTLQKKTYRLTPKQQEAARLIAEYRTVLLEGGSRCWSANTKVKTATGLKRIVDITPGDVVLSQASTGTFEYKPVTDTHQNKHAKRGYRITMKSGVVIEGTEDHRVWFNGGWRTLKHVVESLYGRTMENDSRV